jgi:folylpolyglutamate synthase
MGGRYDATNVLKHKAVNVITQVGLDHQEHLGPTLDAIAYQKCGIFAPNVPIIFSSSNPADVLRVIRHQAQRTRSRALRGDFNYHKKFPPAFPNYLPRNKQPRPGLLSFVGPTHQRENKRLAFFAAHTLLCRLGRAPGLEADLALVRAIDGVHMPGRLQELDLAGAWTRGSVPALVDGAHNAAAAAEVRRPMRSWSAKRARGESDSATFVVAVSDARKVREVVAPLLQNGDSVFAVEFGPVDGMEWRKPHPADAIRAEIDEYATELGMRVRALSGSLREAMHFAEDQYQQAGHPVIVTGSLYLVSDVLRGVRDWRGRGSQPSPQNGRVEPSAGPSADSDLAARHRQGRRVRGRRVMVRRVEYLIRRLNSLPRGVRRDPNVLIWKHKPLLRDVLCRAGRVRYLLHRHSSLPIQYFRHDPKLLIRKITRGLPGRVGAKRRAAWDLPALPQAVVHRVRRPRHPRRTAKLITGSSKTRAAPAPAATAVAARPVVRRLPVLSLRRI